MLEDMVAPRYDATAVFSLPMIDRGITFSDSFSDWSIAGECCFGCVPGSGCIDAFSKLILATAGEPFGIVDTAAEISGWIFSTVDACGRVADGFLYGSSP